MKLHKTLIPALFMLTFGLITLAMTPVVQDHATEEEITVEGTVVDAETGDSLSGVTVNIAEIEASAETDENGAFVIEGLTSGESYTLTIEHDGYEKHEQPIETLETDTPVIKLTIELTPEG